MDGFKRRLNASLQFRLSLTLSLAILLMAIIAGVFSFLYAFDEAHELQDDVLRQVAQLFDIQHLSVPSIPVDRPPQGRDEEARVIVQRLAASYAKPGIDTGGSLHLPLTLPDGLQTLTLDGESFRVLIRTRASGERWAVAQEAEFRNEIARAGALRSVMPFLILVPVLLVIVAKLVGKMFQPIATLSKDIDQRGEQELYPVADEHLPLEVRPFTNAINRLLQRVQQSMDAQGRFVADAAHELRSPLTALSLQAERLAQTAMSAPARARLSSLQQGIERSRNLLDQLLSLAQAQSAGTLPAAPVSVLSMYRRVLEDLIPLAEAKHIDIGVASGSDAEVGVSTMDMIAMLKNLIDNAIRYTPVGGRIDLTVTRAHEQVELSIADNGPGIAEEERERVFAPFYRALGSEQIGSGLGLSIVQAIIQRIGARIELDFADREQQKGLRVSLWLPRLKPETDERR